MKSPEMRSVAGLIALILLIAAAARPRDHNDVTLDRTGNGSACHSTAENDDRSGCTSLLVLMVDALDSSKNPPALGSPPFRWQGARILATSEMLPPGCKAVLEQGVFLATLGGCRWTQRSSGYGR